MDTIYNILSEIRPEFDFKDSGNFVEDGLLDSFDVVLLISALEEKYKIKIDGLDVIPEHFESVEGIAELVAKSGGSI